MPPSHLLTLKAKKYPLPIFFPDATQAVLKTLDSTDIQNTHTLGLLVNTFHLFLKLKPDIIKKHQGIAAFMNWPNAIISDSGGFQVMSLIRQSPRQGQIIDQGIIYKPTKNQRILFTPEDSIKFQMLLNTDLMVVLDDFTPPQADPKLAKQTVDRTIAWARRCRQEFDDLCQQKKLTASKRPRLIAVVQGGNYPDLRRQCAQKLAQIGFDGFGYGGWPLTPKGQFNYQIAQLIADQTPDDYLLYGLGIGKPEQIVNLVKMGYHLFDCVLPTRDARHQRLYVYTAPSINKINPHKKDFYSLYYPLKPANTASTKPVSLACDCLLCTQYTRAYLAHLFRLQDPTAQRLASIHNLRFYSLLMERLR